MTKRLPSLFQVDRDIKRRLAMACCQGSRQESFINEAIDGRPVPVNKYFVGRREFHNIGQSGLPFDSFRNLKKRLVRAGFVVQIDHRMGTVTLIFPEEN